MLGLPPQNTVLDAAAAAQYGDMELVQTLLTRHDASGLLVLPAPVEPMPTDAMLPGEMVNICVALQSVAGHVIVDLPSLFNDYVLALHRSGRRRAARREHGHPEHQEPQDRDPVARPQRDRRIRSCASC